MKAHSGPPGQFVSRNDSFAFYHRLPLLLTISRFILAPTLLILASGDAPGGLLSFVCIAAFLTDLFDGILARQFGVATAALRRLDVIADIVFYLAVLVALFLRRSDIIRYYGWFFLAFILAEALCQSLSFFRFKQSCATHTYLNKLWAVELCIVCSLLFLGQEPAIIVPMTLALGILAYLEVLLILVLAKESPIDVRTIWHLLHQRQRSYPISSDTKAP